MIIMPSTKGAVVTLANRLWHCPPQGRWPLARDTYDWSPRRSSLHCLAVWTPQSWSACCRSSQCAPTDRSCRPADRLRTAPVLCSSSASTHRPCQHVTAHTIGCLQSTFPTCLQCCWQATKTLDAKHSNNGSYHHTGFVGKSTTIWPTVANLI